MARELVTINSYMANGAAPTFHMADALLPGNAVKPGFRESAANH
jgi:hypothetical protein